MHGAYNVKLRSVVLVLTDGCVGCSRSGWGYSEDLRTVCIVPSNLASSSYCVSFPHAAETILHVIDLLALRISIIKFAKIT